MYRIEKETDFKSNVFIKAFCDKEILTTKLVTEQQPLEWCIDYAKNAIELHKNMGKTSVIEVIHTED